MRAIDTVPPNYGFGLDFNYALWTQGTEITMVNVPWNNDYRDIVKFDNRVALNNYIDSLETSGVPLDGLSYVKPNQPIRIPISFNTAYRYNYLRASNPLQPIAGDTTRDFYYFITDVRYIAPNTTEVVVQLDVWQTFGFDITFGNSYIERGHIGIANQKNFDNYGRDYLTIPEGFDVGGEYINIARRRETIMDTGDMDIMVISAVDLEADPGTVQNPKLSSAKGGFTQGIVSGASVYIFNNADTFTTFMSLYSDKPWMTQGIISITGVPDVARYNYSTINVTTATGVVLRKLDFNSSRVGRGKVSKKFINWRNSNEILNSIPLRYRGLRKFFTYPYMIIEMTTWGASPIVIKPESWADADAQINEKAALSPPNQKVVIHPYRYNAGNVTPEVYLDEYASVIQYKDDGGEYLDFATQISNFPTFALVNNMAINYMASNSNSIPFQNQSADWSQQRALASNQTSYDQQSAGIEMSKNINALDRAGMGGMVASNQQALLEGVAVNGMAGVGGAMLNGNLASGGAAIMSQVMGGVNAGISMSQQNRNLTTAQTVSKGTNTGQNNQAGYVRDTNKSLADFAARGDYENTIAGINAKVQDAKMIQPSISGQVGGEVFNLIHGHFEVSLRWKMIDLASIRAVGEHWLRYGYAVRQFAVIPASLNVMSKFTYWKLSETYITSGAMPEYFKQAIRGIFEKGVTVWKTPSDIGNVDIGSNVPLGGFTL